MDCVIIDFSFCLIFQLFAYAAQEHSQKYGSTFEQCAKIAYKNHKHSVHNPNACLRKELPLNSITHSKMICKPITFAMSAPTADGSAAAIVCSREFMESNGMQVCFEEFCFFQKDTVSALYLILKAFEGANQEGWERGRFLEAQKKLPLVEQIIAILSKIIIFLFKFKFVGLNGIKYELLRKNWNRYTFRLFWIWSFVENCKLDYVTLYSCHFYLL